MNADAWRVSLAEALALVERRPAEQRFAYPIRHGTMRAGLYAPRGRDTQVPHVQDELYLVAFGCAIFVKNGERIEVGPHDMLFVEAGADHRFEDFSENFAVWVIFWGPDEGEAAA